MERESVTETLWFRTLTGKFRSTYEATAAAHDMFFVLVPQTCSLSSTTITQAMLQHHLAIPDGSGIRGNFQTLSGRRISMENASVVTDTGFERQIVCKILDQDQRTVVLEDGSRKSIAVLLLISRPLEGGLATPARIDDMDAATIAKFCAMLRSSPETEIVFSVLQDAVDRAALEVRRHRKGTRAPDIHLQLAHACSTAADALLTTTFYADEPRGTIPAHHKQLLQVLESVVMEPLHARVYDLMLDVKSEEIARIAAHLSARKPSFDDAKVSKHFRCDYGNVAAVLGLLHSSATPLEKLQCLRDAQDIIYKNINRHLIACKKDVDDFSVGTDDVLPILRYVIHLGFHAHNLHQLPAHLEYISLFHFADDTFDSSVLGHVYSNFQQMLQVFDEPFVPPPPSAAPPSAAMMDAADETSAPAHSTAPEEGGADHTAAHSVSEIILSTPAAYTGENTFASADKHEVVESERIEAAELANDVITSTGEDTTTGNDES